MKRGDTAEEMRLGLCGAGGWKVNRAESLRRSRPEGLRHKNHQSCNNNLAHLFSRSRSAADKVLFRERVRRIQPDRLAEVRDRVVQLLLGLQDHAEVVVRLGVGRLDGERLLVELTCLREAPGRLPHHAEVVVRFRKVRLFLDRALEVPGGRIEIAARRLGVPEVVEKDPCVGRVRTSEPQRFAQMRDRFVNFPGAQVREAESPMNRGIVGILLQHRGIARDVPARRLARVVLFEARQIRAVCRHDLHPEIRHLVGRLTSIPDAHGRPIGVPRVGRRVVVRYSIAIVVPFGSATGDA